MESSDAVIRVPVFYVFMRQNIPKGYKIDTKNCWKSFNKNVFALKDDTSFEKEIKIGISFQFTKLVLADGLWEQYCRQMFSGGFQLLAEIMSEHCIIPYVCK